MITVSIVFDNENTEINAILFSSKLKYTETGREVYRGTMSSGGDCFWFQ
jgi:hypothetical protein